MVHSLTAQKSVVYGHAQVLLRGCIFSSQPFLLVLPQDEPSRRDICQVSEERLQLDLDPAVSEYAHLDVYIMPDLCSLSSLFESLCSNLAVFHFRALSQGQRPPLSSFKMCIVSRYSYLQQHVFPKVFRKLRRISSPFTIALHQA